MVGLLAILDCYINICVGPPNTCVASKQFNLLPPNTYFWSNFIHYSLTHLFEAITLGLIQNFGITLTETDKLRLESYLRLLLTARPELLNSRFALYFPCDLNHPWKFDWQTGRQDRQADQKTSMLLVVTNLKRLIYNIN